MKTMTWEEIDRSWNGVQKRHRMEIALTVARYCVGHSMEEVAKHLGYEVQWARKQLDYAGVGIGIGGVDVNTPLAGRPGEQRSADDAVRQVVAKFAPKVEVKLDDDGKGSQSIATVEGDDAEDFQPYLDHYVQQGQTPAAATRLAKAEWAAEEAVGAGVIRESYNKQKKRVHQILFPGKTKECYEIDLRMHMARVKSAARFLDTAKIHHLRRKATCERVAAANKAWLEQVERVFNLHPTLVEE